MSGILFAFDLDGTLTLEELLPRIAGHLNLREEMARLTALTLRGELGFSESFIRRVHMLKSIPVAVVREIVGEVALDPHLERFVRENRADCCVVTGNLDCWIAPLVERLGCRAFTSRAAIQDGRPVLQSVLDKGNALRELSKTGKRVVAIGDSVNDLPMFAAADVGIAFGGVHEPAPALLRAADAYAPDSRVLCAMLRRLQAWAATAGLSARSATIRALAGRLLGAEPTVPDFTDRVKGLMIDG